ncbi:MAG: tetraacyldisaccharide 4'-kinase, partial [Gammaproteobacteria bacterium]
VDGTHQYASFGHLAGYSSNYYTYQWSNAIAEELLSRFKKEGLRNKKTANDYRHKVLAATGTKSANDLVTDFLGRQFSIDAYVERLGKGE